MSSPTYPFIVTQDFILSGKNVTAGQTVQLTKAQATFALNEGVVQAPPVLLQVESETATATTATAAPEAKSGKAIKS